MKINVTIATDEHYAKYTYIVLLSILKNKSEHEEPVFYILDGGLSSESKERLRQLGECVNIVEIDRSDFSQFESITTKHWTLPTLFRLRLASILPDVEKVIYLDCDTLVLKSLKDYWEEDIEDFCLGASEDFNAEESAKRLKMPDGTVYFNAGSILLNLKKWREEGVEEKLFEYLRENSGELKFLDQDVLNAVLYDRTKIIDKKFNCLVPSDYQTHERKEKWEELKKTAHILHYVGWKPWEVYNKSLLKDVFWDYWTLSPYHSENTEFYANLKKREACFNFKPVRVLNYILTYPFFIFKAKRLREFGEFFK
ncbi:glycosyl transferase family 8 [Candidatus Gastranaerophilus sp. (ex Termes propinquus)]|nr:glycosyl transferase family 8 [Candidatus Gastranaerophilus sp. (ex Termes propinquus)]